MWGGIGRGKGTALATGSGFGLARLGVEPQRLVSHVKEEAAIILIGKGGLDELCCLQGILF